MLTAIAFLPVHVAADDTETGNADPAAGTQLVPARFADGPEKAADKIAFPRYTRDISLFVNCVAGIAADASVSYWFCLDYYGSDDEKFHKAIEKSFGSLTFTPAVVDGQPVAAEMYFRIFFGRHGDQYAVGIYPNWGNDAGKYGLEYEAPQRFGEKPEYSGCNSTGTVSKIAIDANGYAFDGVEITMSLSKSVGRSGCDQWIDTTADEGRFIPAHSNGKPVSAFHTEFWGDPKWITLSNPID